MVFDCINLKIEYKSYLNKLTFHVKKKKLTFLISHTKYVYEIFKYYSNISYVSNTIKKFNFNLLYI